MTPESNTRAQEKLLPLAAKHFVLKMSGIYSSVARLLFSLCKVQWKKDNKAGKKKSLNMLVYSEDWLGKAKNWSFPVSILSNEKTFKDSLSLIDSTSGELFLPLFRLFSVSFLKSEPWVRFCKNALSASFSPQIGLNGCFDVSASIFQIRTESKIEGTVTSDANTFYSKQKEELFFKEYSKKSVDVLWLLGQPEGKVLLSSKPIKESVTMSPNAQKDSKGSIIPSLLFNSIVSNQRRMEILYTLSATRGPKSRLGVFNITGHVGTFWDTEDAGLITFSDFEKIEDVCDAHVTFVLENHSSSPLMNAWGARDLELADQTHTDFFRGHFNQGFIKMLICSLAVQYEPKDVKPDQRYTGEVLEDFCGVKWDGNGLHITNSENGLFTKSKAAMRSLPSNSLKIVFENMEKEKESDSAQESSQKKQKRIPYERLKPMQEYIDGNGVYSPPVPEEQEESPKSSQTGSAKKRKKKGSQA